MEGSTGSRVLAFLTCTCEVPLSGMLAIRESVDEATFHFFFSREQGRALLERYKGLYGGEMPRDPHIQRIEKYPFPETSEMALLTLAGFTPSWMSTRVEEYATKGSNRCGAAFGVRLPTPVMDVMAVRKQDTWWIGKREGFAVIVDPTGAHLYVYFGRNQALDICGSHKEHMNPADQLRFQNAIWAADLPNHTEEAPIHIKAGVIALLYDALTTSGMEL